VYLFFKPVIIDIKRVGLPNMCFYSGMSCYFSRVLVLTQASLGLKPHGKHLEIVLTKYVTDTVTKSGRV